MRNRVKTTTAAAAVVAGLTGVAIAGGFSVAAADTGDGSGATTEWCDGVGNHDGWDADEHGQFHEQMESHMTDFMGMGMGMSDGFDFGDMGPSSGMGSMNMGRGPAMGR